MILHYNNIIATGAECDFSAYRNYTSVPTNLDWFMFPEEKFPVRKNAYFKRYLDSHMSYCYYRC
jgi:hypothetical protein